MRNYYGTAVIAMFALGATARAAVVYVDVGASPGGDGTTWCIAKNDLRGVLDTAASGDIIRVASGIYVTGVCDPSPCTPSSAERFDSFVLHNGVQVYGGYAGCGAQDPDARTEETILSGDLNGDDDPNFGPQFPTHAENNYHVVVPDTHVGATTLLDGLTIYGGRADADNPPRTDGGGMYNVDADLTISSCVFRKNLAIFGGGMINLGGSDPNISNCRFEDNIARNFVQGGGAGGAIDNFNSIPTLTDCEFFRNEAATNGGAIMYKEALSAGILTRCLFVEN